MLIGKECFNDTELRAFFDSLGKVGICGITGRQDIVVDFGELESFLSATLGLFAKDASLLDIAAKVDQDWNLFSSVSVGTQILKQTQDFRSEPLPKIQMSLYTSNISRVKESWEHFKEEIRWERRYLVDKGSLSLDAEWDKLLRVAEPSIISPAQCFYRSRIHSEADSSVYSPDEMGAPPKELACSGRANPAGIPYLYLCEHPSTTLYEVRALYLDDVSVGRFELRESVPFLKIADFTTSLSLYDMYSIGAYPMEDMIRAHILHKAINQDLSKPIRRYDSTFEYIPTQFICEYMRYEIGLDGIKYYSALRPKEINVVLFEPDNMICTEVFPVQITTTNIISTPDLSQIL